MILDFGKLKNIISCCCIFRKSIASHKMFCNFVRHFYYRLGKAATAMRAQMCEIFGHVRFLFSIKSKDVKNSVSIDMLKAKSIHVLRGFQLKYRATLYFSCSQQPPFKRHLNVEIRNVDSLGEPLSWI